MTTPTTPVATAARESHVGRADTDRRSDRVLFAVVSVAAVVPFFWAAVRDARNGFFPTSDVAATVLRARDVFSSHPPLVGMWSSGSTWAGHEIHFPGAIQLYLLAVPVRLLGSTWGPLLAMATLNACWVLLAGWLVRRRFGTHAALIALATITAFLWSIGSENLISPRPMQMVTIPFLCFLFLAWLVADGDIDALPAFAIVANFLFLDHLVQAVQIPVISACAIAGLLVWYRRGRRADPERRPPAFDRVRRRIAQTATITAVMWLPSLVEQLTNRPGNLALLVRAAERDRESVDSFTVAYNTVVRPIATPDFWFRGRFDRSTFHRGLDTLGVGDVIAGVVVLAVFVGLGAVAFRRGDRTVITLLAVAVVAILVSFVTVTQSPAIWGFLPYVRSVWALAAFVWFAVAFAAWRMFAGPVRAHVARVAGVLAVVFCLFATSYADFGSMTDLEGGPIARRMVDTTVPELTGRGPVLVRSTPDFASERYFTSLLLGLDSAGVHYCVEGIAVAQFGDFHDCGADAAVAVVVDAGRGHRDTGGTVLSETATLDPAEQRTLDRATRTTDRWFATHDRVDLTTHGEALLTARDPDGLAGDPFAPTDGDLTGLLDSGMFRLFLGAQATHLADPDLQEPVFADPDLPVADLLTRIDLGKGAHPIVVRELPTDRPRSAQSSPEGR